MNPLFDKFMPTSVPKGLKKDLVGLISFHVNEELPENTFVMLGDKSAAIYINGHIRSFVWDEEKFEHNTVSLAGLRETTKKE